MTHSTARWTSWVALMAVGMLLTAAGSTSAQTDVTFARDVAPILQRSCQGCHRTGQMAPMSLMTYAEVRPWARAIRSKVSQRVMPPWHLDKTVGIQEYQNDISLSDAQIDTIVRWVDAGAPRGNPADLPPALDWPDDQVWHLAEKYSREPDLVVSSDSWTQAAEGQDQWWQPYVPTGLTEDRWVTGIEVRPSLPGRRIVHHSVIYLQQQEDPGDFTPVIDAPGRGNYFSEFAVGKIGDVFRENTGKLLKAGSRLGFDIHYHSLRYGLRARYRSSYIKSRNGSLLRQRNSRPQSSIAKPCCPPPLAASYCSVRGSNKKPRFLTPIGFDCLSSPRRIAPPEKLVHT